MRGARERSRRTDRWAVPRVAVAAAVALQVTVAGAHAQPAVSEVEIGGASYAMDVSRHHGYETVRWSQVPGSVVSGSFQSGGVATGRLGGRILELRAGSPFGRHGESVFQLSNPPYRQDGEIWVPLELFSSVLRHLETALPDTGQPAAAVPASAVAETDSRPIPGQRTPGPWRVVIDAGHGGVDPGTISPRSGTREKDITLAVSKKLARELEQRGNMAPLLTRDRDVFVEVMQRPRLAVDWEADLFISIHVDAQPGGRTSARGFTTYHLGQARTEEALRVAQRENAVIELEEGARPPNMEQVEFILAQVDRQTYRRESQILAGHIQNGLRGAVDTKDRGARQGPYYVLMTPGRVPAVLVELGYITNRADERLLTDEDRQDRIAKALADTIEGFLEDTGRRIAAAEGRG